MFSKIERRLYVVAFWAALVAGLPALLWGGMSLQRGIDYQVALGKLRPCTIGEYCTSQMQAQVVRQSEGPIAQAGEEPTHYLHLKLEGVGREVKVDVSQEAFDVGQVGAPANVTIWTARQSIVSLTIGGISTKTTLEHKAETFIFAWVSFSGALSLIAAACIGYLLWVPHREKNHSMIWLEGPSIGVIFTAHLALGLLYSIMGLVHPYFLYGIFILTIPAAISSVRNVQDVLAKRR